MEEEATEFSSSVQKQLSCVLSVERIRFWPKQAVCNLAHTQTLTSCGEMLNGCEDFSIFGDNSPFEYVVSCRSSLLSDHILNFVWIWGVVYLCVILCLLQVTCSLSLVESGKTKWLLLTPSTCL